MVLARRVATSASRLVGAPAQHERERGRGGRVQPLGVVEGHQDGLVAGEVA